MGLVEVARVGHSVPQLYREIARLTGSDYVNKRKVRRVAIRTGLLRSVPGGGWVFKIDDLPVWLQFHWEPEGLGRMAVGKCPMNAAALDRLEEGNIRDRRKGRRGSRPT